MKKIVELRIDQEDLEFEGLGVDIMSLVNQPAIGVDWMAFSQEQFVEPVAGESEDSFIGRCIPKLLEEGYDKEQATAICYSYWQEGFECADCFDDLEDACKPGYTAIGLKPKGGRMVPNCVPVEAQQFESYADYPESVSNNAKRGIELNEAVNNKCATQVGKVRAQQLAKGEGVSFETVKRMYSYLSRAEVYYDAGDKESCGYISYLLWGGKSAKTWAESKIKEVEREKMLAIAASEEFGEYYDNETIIIDGTKNEFNTIGDWLKGVAALDILGRRDIDADQSEIKYRYAGPTAQRNFCKAMQRMQKLYSWEELQEMGRRVGNGMPVYGDREFNIIDWKGGPNCKHYWEEVVVFKKDSRATMMISRGPAAGQAGTTPYNSNNHGYRMSFQFADEAKREIVGPAMIPQQLIPRRDAMGNMYHVYFTKETVAKIAEKFLKENKHNNTDVNHDDLVVTDNTLLESWIIEDKDHDKSGMYGYDLPEGTWMVKYKINDEQTWNKIKSGELKGFSIAGNFIEKAASKL